jgi:hypothetical protein
VTAVVALQDVVAVAVAVVFTLLVFASVVLRLLQAGAVLAGWRRRSAPSRVIFDPGDGRGEEQP